MKNNVKKRRNYWPLIYGILLTAYTVFALLEAFVLPSDIVQVEDIKKQSSSASNNEDDNIKSEPVITETSYKSNNISITITTLRRYETQVYVADIVLKDISYLQTAVANGTFGRNIKDTTSAMAKENDAILAINGDYYGFHDRGYVLRNGYLYRETKHRSRDYDDLAIYEDGHFEIFYESQYKAKEIADAGAVQIFSFGPGLVKNNKVIVGKNSEVTYALQSNPRTAIGEIEPLHYVMVVSDGRTEESEGLTLYELAQVMEELGCKTAYNLDGGGSSTMWFMGRVVNCPTDGKKSGERRISDIVYIGE